MRVPRCQECRAEPMLIVCMRLIEGGEYRQNEFWTCSCQQLRQLLTTKQTKWAQILMAFNQALPSCPNQPSKQAKTGYEAGTVYVWRSRNAISAESETYKHFHWHVSNRPFQILLSARLIGVPIPSSSSHRNLTSRKLKDHFRLIAFCTILWSKWLVNLNYFSGCTNVIQLKRSTTIDENVPKRVRELVDIPSPTATAIRPACAGNCQEILEANVACVTANPLNDCFCSILSWPTACAGDCSADKDRTSLAQWYWDVCPSVMDSRLGQFGLSSVHSSLDRTVDAWAVQTPGNGVLRTGFNCYYSGQCGITTSISAPATSAPLGPKSGGGGHVNVAAIAIAVPLFLFVVILIGFLLVYRHARRRQIQQQNQVQQNQVMTQVLLRVLDVLTINRPNQPSQQNLAPDIAALNRRMQGLENNANNLGNRVEALMNRLGNDPDHGAMDEIEKSLAEALTCPVCLDILYNPVSAITASTNRNRGCRRFRCSFTSYHCSFKLIDGSAHILWSLRRRLFAYRSYMSRRQNSDHWHE